jgi:hypothetical protein
VSVHLEEWFAGYRRYRRHERGDITETDDHLLRATGLLLVHGLGLAITENRAASEASETNDMLANCRCVALTRSIVVLRASGH